MKFQYGCSNTVAHSLLLCPWKWLRSIVMVCLSVCLSVSEDISGTTCVIFTKSFVHVAYVCCSVLLRHVDDRLHYLLGGRGWRECIEWSECNLRCLVCVLWHHVYVEVLVLADNSIMTSCVSASEAQHETTYFCERLPLMFNKLSAGWLCATVVERQSFAGKLSLSCARPVADGWPLMWVSHPL